MKKIIRWIFGIVGGIFLLAALFLLVCDSIATVKARHRLYDDVALIPHREVGVVLGISPRWGGAKRYRNLYTQARESGLQMPALRADICRYKKSGPTA